MNKVGEILINLLVLLISPLLSITFNLIIAIKGKFKKTNVFYTAASLALIIIYLPPLFDNISYFWFFEVISQFDFIRFIRTPGVDVLYYTPFYIGRKIGFDYRTISYIYYFLIFYLWILIYWKIKIKSKCKKYDFLFLLFFILNFSYRDVADLTRFMLATSIFIFSVFLILIENKKIGYLCLICTLFIHFSYIFPLFLFLLSITFLKKVRVSYVKFFAFMLMGVLITDISLLFLKYIPIKGNFKGKIVRYLVERKFQTSVFDRGITGIFVLIGIISCALAMFYLYKIYKEYKNIKYFNFLIILGLVLASMYFDRVLFERNGILFRMSFLSFAYLDYKLRNKLYFKNFLILILILFSVKSIAENIRYLKWSLSKDYPVITNNTKKDEIFIKLFYMPGFMLLDMNKNSYNDDWHRENTYYRDYEYMKRKKY